MKTVKAQRVVRAAPAHVLAACRRHLARWVGTSAGKRVTKRVVVGKVGAITRPLSEVVVSSNVMSVIGRSLAEYEYAICSQPETKILGRTS